MIEDDLVLKVPIVNNLRLPQAYIDNVYQQIERDGLSLSHALILSAAYSFSNPSHREDIVQYLAQRYNHSPTKIKNDLLAKEEIQIIENQLTSIEDQITPLLLSSDPRDQSNIFLEIRAGTGGDEAAIFAGDIFRMYARYCEEQKWSIEILNQSESGQGGFKEIIARVIGDSVFCKLKFESGTHRVQRIPKTESQGRIHTSACTVAVIPEVDEVNEIEINTNDLRIDTYRASGAGGQHVNKTDSAVRLTHIPTGVVAECQDNRSQHKNKAKAITLLKARIYDMEQKKIADQQAEERKMLVGSGDRSERIRTYNFPQGRITDHRIGLTLYNLSEIMEGDLHNLIDSLAQENAAKQMSELEN